ncbi:MAG: hypothetical protein LUE14_00470 [Clostridiales bacterium]|nr:hypothetical protein [Clostridiales bacterium]
MYTEPAARLALFLQNGEIIKMFPVSKKYLRRYRTEGNDFAILIQDIIDRNAKQIITACQDYLTAYEGGERPVILSFTIIDSVLVHSHTLTEPIPLNAMGFPQNWRNITRCKP